MWRRLRNRFLEEKRVVTAARLTSAAGSRVPSKHKVGTSGTRALPGLIRINVFHSGKLAVSRMMRAGPNSYRPDGRALYGEVSAKGIGPTQALDMNSFTVRI
jgi:hypothetical protein